MKTTNALNGFELAPTTSQGSLQKPRIEESAGASEVQPRAPHAPKDLHNSMKQNISPVDHRQDTHFISAAEKKVMEELDMLLGMVRERVTELKKFHNKTSFKVSKPHRLENGGQSRFRIIGSPLSSSVRFFFIFLSSSY
jgi:hypothetical protein